MKSRALGVTFLIIGLLIIIAPRYIVPYCELTGKTRMSCSYSSEAEIFVGLIIISISLSLFLSKTPSAIRTLMLPALMSGVSVIAIPEVIGYCHNPQMPCHYGTVPVLRLLGIACVLTSIVGLLSSRHLRRVHS